MSTTVRGEYRSFNFAEPSGWPLWVVVLRRKDNREFEQEIQLDDQCGLAVDNQECTPTEFTAWMRVHEDERIGVLFHDFLEDTTLDLGVGSARRATFYSE